MLQEQFKKILIHYRKETNTSRKNMADILNVSESLIGAYERGERNIPLEVAEKLCSIANRTVTIPFIPQKENENRMQSCISQLIELIQEEATERQYYTRYVLEEVVNSLEEQLEQQIFTKEIIAEKFKEIGDSKYFFIDKEYIENIWYTDNLNDLEEVDEEGYVVLWPLHHYEKLSTEKKDLVQIEREDAITLIKSIIWKEDLEHELSEEYKTLANELTKVKN